jgi:hypothetical protein
VLGANWLPESNDETGEEDVNGPVVLKDEDLELL